jgi:hypothetical protein
VRERLLGLLVFLPVPFVLGLFTRQPLGAWLSLGAGLLVMLSHRLYARPFALRRAGRRCLWCGGAAGDGPALTVEEPPGPSLWRACGEPHLVHVSRTLAWAARRALLLRVGIVGALAVFLIGATLAPLLGSPRWTMADAIALFQIGVAVTVLPLAFLGPRGRATDTPARVPFAVHIQALIGTLWVLWLFRLVGLSWLAAGLVHFVRRLA